MVFSVSHLLNSSKVARSWPPNYEEQRVLGLIPVGHGEEKMKSKNPSLTFVTSLTVLA